MKILLWDLGTRRRELNEPLGIEMLAGALQRKVPEVQTDLRWEDAGPNSAPADLSQYHLVGLSTKLATYPSLINIINAARTLPEPPLIVLGDVLATFAYKELLAAHPEVLCVLGEGETAFAAIAEVTRRCSTVNCPPLQGIPNLAFVSNGHLVETPRFQENASLLPAPDRRFLRWTIEHRGIARVEASRGCSWSACQFCCVQAKYGGGGWRPFPTDFIVRQLSEVSSAGSVAPYFSDEDFFGGDHQRAIALAEAINDAKQAGLISNDISFFISARANDLVGTEGRKALVALKRAGLREVFVGLEAGSSVQLRRYGKPTTPDLNKAALDVLRQLGLQIDIGYILFEPEMTFEELSTNAQYLRDIDLADHDARSIKDLRVQPLTALAEKYAKRGLISGPLDINSLRYPVSYRDERVAWVRDQFAEYEEPAMSEVYHLQASSRGEVPNGHYRSWAKGLLGLARAVDLKHLKTLISFASRSIGKSEFDRATTEHCASREHILQFFQAHKHACMMRPSDIAENPPPCGALMGDACFPLYTMPAKRSVTYEWSSP